MLIMYLLMYFLLEFMLIQSGKEEFIYIHATEVPKTQF